jgi:hypothetical protein
MQENITKKEAVSGIRLKIIPDPDPGGTGIKAPDPGSGSATQPCRKKKNHFPQNPFILETFQLTIKIIPSVW